MGIFLDAQLKTALLISVSASFYCANDVGSVMYPSNKPLQNFLDHIPFLFPFFISFFFSCLYFLWKM